MLFALGIQQNLDKVRAYSLSNGDQPAALPEAARGTREKVQRPAQS